MVPAQYHDFRDVFSKEAFDELPPWKVWDHAIDLTPGTELPHSQMFPLSPAEQKELDDFLQENLAVMVQPPFPFSTHLWPPPSLSTSAPPLLPPLHSNSEACLCNLRNCITPTLRLTTDQHWTCSDLVPTPRAADYIPFLHSSYLPDPFSLTVMCHYSFLV